MSNKILVTGASGWLGKAFLRKIFDGSTSTNFSEIKLFIKDKAELDLLSAFTKKGVTFSYGDLKNKESIDLFLENSEGATVFNLAGIIHPNIFNQSDFNLINNIGVTYLAKRSINYGIKKFVSMSSNSPNGYTKNNKKLFTENTPYFPYMGYGKSKMQMEQNLIDLSKQQKNTNFTIIRAPWFYGPDQPKRQSEFFSMIKNGRFPVIGTGENIRSMSYVDNLVEGVILASKYFDKNGEIFWIADERPYSMNEIIGTIKDLMRNEFSMDVSKRQLKLPSFISDSARYIDYTSQSLGIYIQKIHVLSEMNQNIACSITKAKDVLGYKPNVSLREGMKNSLNWCLENNLRI